MGRKGTAEVHAGTDVLLSLGENEDCFEKQRQTVAGCTPGM